MFTVKKTFSILSIFALLLVSCADDGADGPVGPVGPEGQIGPPGNDGTDGTDGQDGRDGAVNIRTSNYTVVQGDWDGAGRAPKFNSDITFDIVTDGLVNVYRTTSVAPDSTSMWRSVPDGTFAFEYRKDSIIFLTPGFTGASFTTYYKVVVVPSEDKIQGVNMNNFEEVKMVYGLKEEELFRQ